MFLKETQVDIKDFFHERIMSMVGQELVLKTHKDSSVSEMHRSPLLGGTQFSDSKVTFSRYYNNL